MGRARVCQASRGGARAGKYSFPTQCVKCLAFSVAPVSQPHTHLVLKALGSERPVLGWNVGVECVTSGPRGIHAVARL